MNFNTVGRLRLDRRRIVVAANVAMLAMSLTAVPRAAVSNAAAPGSGEAMPRAQCGPGSRPESGIQGRVPRSDRVSGRSVHGYSCNMRLVGRFQGKGAGPVSAVYGHCAYTGTFTGDLISGKPGVQVLDVSDPARPRLTATLRSPAMSTVTWETLKVHPGRGLLAAVGVPVAGVGVGVGSFDIYDVRTDCAHPRLLNRIPGTNLTPPLPLIGHEGGFSHDGTTYYATGPIGSITAIDVHNARTPRVVWSGSVGLSNHGLSLSRDGKTMYGVSAVPPGVQILDVSDIQERRQLPMVPQLSHVTWPGRGLLTQMTIPFVRNGRRMLVAVDEAGNGGVRILDIHDAGNPRVVKRLRLAISLDASRAQRAADVGGDGLFGYEAHYCTLDRYRDPTALACGYFHSGIRVFDIRRPSRPREIAYFNPPAQSDKTLADLPNSTHALLVASPPLLSLDSLTFGGLVDSVLHPRMTADWCMSPPFFARGGRQLWATCNDNGFLALKFTNGAYPLR